MTEIEVIFLVPGKKRKPYLETSVLSSTNEKEEAGRLEEPQVISTTVKVSQFGKVAEMIKKKLVQKFCD